MERHRRCTGPQRWQ